MIAVTAQGATLDADAVECLQEVGIEPPAVTGSELQAWAEQQLASEDSVLVRAVLEAIIGEVIVATRVTAPGTVTLQ